MPTVCQMHARPSVYKNKKCTSYSIVETDSQETQITKSICKDNVCTKANKEILYREKLDFWMAKFPIKVAKSTLPMLLIQMEWFR